MKIALSAESTIDLTKELIEKYNINIVPFKIILGDQEKIDGEISNDEIFKYVKDSGKLPKTSAINSYEYEEYFRRLLEKYDAVIHFSLSSEISSACRNAMISANEFPGKVYVIDTKSLSTGIALQAIYAYDLIISGEPIESIVEKINKRVGSMQASFVLKQLDYLYKGGRCSKLAMFGANIFHICPQIVVKEGKMDAGKKYRGDYKKVINQYVDDTLSQFNNPDLNNVFITYPSLDNKENIIPEIIEKLKAKGFKNIHETIAGGTIACHCGPNTIGVIYYNDGTK